MASQTTVLIIALTSIATFLIPGLYTAIFIWNVIIVIFASFLGITGFFTAAILLCAHLAGLTSYGYPYLYPLGTLKVFKYDDLLMRGDLNKINKNIFRED
jgi:spore germination protein KA